MLLEIAESGTDRSNDGKPRLTGLKARTLPPETRVGLAHGGRTISSDEEEVSIDCIRGTTPGEAPVCGPRSPRVQERERPMPVWQLDVMGGVRLANGTELKVVIGIRGGSVRLAFGRR